jgi:hypothetical protein
VVAPPIEEAPITTQEIAVEAAAPAVASAEERSRLALLTQLDETEQWLAVIRISLALYCPSTNPTNFTNP